MNALLLAACLSGFAGGLVSLAARSAWRRYQRARVRRVIAAAIAREGVGRFVSERRPVSFDRSAEHRFPDDGEIVEDGFGSDEEARQASLLNGREQPLIDPTGQGRK